ncbi:MAG: hypothetical protein AAGH68_01850 [Pseudomonadota bacterium]
MTAQNRRIVYFMLHVPKCAGSTLIGHMDKHLGERSLEAPLWRNWRRNYIGNRYPFKPGDREVEEVALFHGHALSRSLAAHFPDEEIREAVTLRDPVGFFVSMYNYRAKRAVDGVGPEDPPFEVWYAAERKNPITRFLLYRYYGWAPWWLWLTSSKAKLAWLEERLARYWFVGSYRDMNMLVNSVAEQVGIPGDPERRNESTVKKVSADTLDRALLNKILDENAVDAALFDRWKDRLFDSEAGPADPHSLPANDWIAQIRAEIVSGIKKALIRQSRR